MDAETRCLCTESLSELRNVLNKAEWKTEYMPINKKLLPLMLSHNLNERISFSQILEILNKLNIQ